MVDLVRRQLMLRESYGRLGEKTSCVEGETMVDLVRRHLVERELWQTW